MEEGDPMDDLPLKSLCEALRQLGAKNSNEEALAFFRDYSLMFVFLTLIRYYGRLTLWTIFLGNGGVHFTKHDCTILVSDN